MRNGMAFWMVCLSLVFTRLLGTHLHTCAGIEAGVQHAGSHYADNGFLFGEHHSEDDHDDLEVQFVAVVSSKVQSEFSDLSAPLPDAPALAPFTAQLLTVAAPCGPPQALAAYPPHFTPPLRGPPTALA